MREHVRAHFTGQFESVGIARGREPDRQLRLDWTGQDLHWNFFAFGIAKQNCLAAPQFLHDFDLLEHDLLALGMISRSENEIIYLPAGSERDRHTAAGKVVHYGPFFSHSNR